jgi:hypothetical protein
MSRIKNTVSGATLLICLFFNLKVKGAHIELWTASSYLNVFNDQPKPEWANTNIQLIVAKNEFEAAQIMIRSDEIFTIKEVRFTNLKSGANKILLSNLNYYFVEYDYLSGSTHFGRQPINNYIRKGPGYFPDGLSNDKSLTIRPNTTQSIWIRTYIPAKTMTGVYSGAAIICTNLGNFKVNITVDVQNVAIPDPESGSFSSAMSVQYYNPISWDPSGPPPRGGDLKQHYGWDVLTPQWWKLMASYAQVMKEYRSNVLPVNYHFMLMDAPGTTFDTVTLKYIFDWSVFDTVVQYFISHAGIKLLNGQTMAQTANGINRFQTQIIDKDKTGHLIRTWVPPDSRKSLAWINQFYPALKEHLDAKGWTKRWLQTIGDEPNSSQLLSDYQYLEDKLRTVWPNVRVEEAVFNPVYHHLTGQINLWVANTLAFDPDESFFHKRQTEGDEVWFYTCNIPVGQYLNRFIDAPVWSMRSLIWNCYLHDVTGYLHWGYNAWGYDTPGKVHESSEKGDNYIVKPDIVHNKLKATIRYEAQRDGIEDYELFKILERKDPELAKSIAKSLVTSNTQYTKDIPLMMRMREALVRAAANSTRK